MNYFLHIALLVTASLLISTSCGSKKLNQHFDNQIVKDSASTVVSQETILLGADRYDVYLPLLKKKKVAIVNNQTGLLIINYKNDTLISDSDRIEIVRRVPDTVSIVDFLIENKFQVQKIFAPEHGFRGTADAGEHIIDGKDVKTGLPIVSLYGNNKKPKPEQLQGIDVLIFDLQDVGARFYTYSSLHYVMEACAHPVFRESGWLRRNPPRPATCP